MRWLFLCALLPVCALVTPGCGGPVEVREDAGHADVPDAGVEAPDAGTEPTDAGPSEPEEPEESRDAGPTDPEEPERECLSFDPPDELGLDDDCDGAEGTRAVSVYVSSDGDDVFGGSPAYPVRTLTRAAALIRQNPTRRFVYVASAPEPYAAEGLGELLELGANVYGSLSRAQGWSRPEGAEAVRTTFVTNGQGVLAEVTAPQVTFAFARLVSVREDGELHSVGLSLSGQGTVELLHVDIETDDGADGEDGQEGLTPPSPAEAGGPNVCGNSGLYLPYRGGSGAGPSACPGVGTSGLTRGGNGGDGNRNSNAPEHGAAGGNGQGGAGGERGYNPGNGTGDRKGRDGLVGPAGSHGAHAQAHGEADWSVAEGRVFWASRAEAAHGAVGRGGGGGGGSQSGGGDCGSSSLANGGAGGGAGGCPGLAGVSGRSGGFSIGIISRGTLPSFHGVRITTGRGGAGGRAGEGGRGALGGAGGVSVRSDLNQCGVSSLPMNDCRAGGDGGAGGRGGNGGHGASGAGGWSIGLVSTRSLPDVPEGLEGLTVSVGAAGTAGAPVSGGPAGAGGQAVELLLK